MIRAVIVDDEAPARERLRRMLAPDLVAVVGEAADGHDAIAQIARLAPDLVFLDIQMPGLTGLEVVARLEPPRPRVIFCTAYDAFAIDAFEHHALDYLLKPVNQERLNRSVERLAAELEERRRRMRDTEEAARTQAHLMPRGRVAVNGLDCAGASRPASGIGGDYFDILSIDADCTALALGDISGKGAYAGLLAAALQARMQALVARGPRDPAAIVDDLNRMTTGTMESHRFATLFFALFDAGSRTLRCANAGHPAALLLAADGTVREIIMATGPVIGWTPDAVFESLAITVESGDLLVLCSDGITETVDSGGRELGTQGLAEIVASRRSGTAAEIVCAAMGEVERFSNGAPAADDRTLLVARVL